MLGDGHPFSPADEDTVRWFLLRDIMDHVAMPENWMRVLEEAPISAVQEFHERMVVAKHTRDAKHAPEAAGGPVANLRIVLDD